MTNFYRYRQGVNKINDMLGGNGLERLIFKFLVNISDLQDSHFHGVLSQLATL
ncbi:Uncharacterised protein [Yersinia intermedia]|uniref:hypothetical protein n=1 Tax=Yersinia intermedia TaxID=631 RepID=UPI0005E99B03|nr:hypothetical protein [Yersinia intermedia]CNI40759.1 Uncharacterised protein [Yersinia intermedia]CQJ67504.1 Uncharacterised protein [Yersinia intermedia]